MSEKNQLPQCGSHQILMDELRSLKEEVKGKGSDSDGWKRWQHFVLEKLDSLTKWMEEISKEQGNIRVEVATLKTKAGFWGLVAGTVPVAILLGINFLK